MNHTQFGRTASKFGYTVLVLIALFTVSGVRAASAIEESPIPDPSVIPHAPTITLNGDATMNLTVGDTFVDPGVTTADADGDAVVVATVTVPGAIDTSVAGTFTITYTATDPGGLTAIATRVVVVAAASTDGGSGGSTPTSGPLTIIATAITCPSESDLPNWGDKGPAMNASTVSTFLAAHPTCHTVSGWGLQWGLGGHVSDMGATYIGAAPASSGWTSFGPTDANGVATVSISDLQGSGDVWFREELPANYVPFSEPPIAGSGSKNNVSAEAYCASDVLNYDNYDAIYGAQLNTTYYCATFNALTDGGPVTPPAGPNTPPTIIVTGANPITITVNTDYTDLGATATDTEDGDITSKIVTTGTVSTTTVGTYFITYSVTDSGGMTSTNSRTVNVVATPVTNTPPVITIFGDNPTTININTDYTDAGASSTDAEDGDITASMTTTSTVSTTTVGTYTVTYVVTDSGGLTSTSTRTVNVVDPGTSTPGCTVNCGGGGGGSGPNIGFGGGGGGSGPLFAAITSGNLNTSLTCPLLRDYLRFGANNDPTEVIKLQAFLSRVEGYNVDVNGTFDQKTLDGVNAFQTKYLSQVMGPWDATRSSGYVYITTKKKINEIACNSAFIINSSEQSIIDAYKAANGQNGQFGPGTSTTSPDIGFNATSSGATDGSNQVAGAANASVLSNFWNFLKHLFGFGN